MPIHDWSQAPACLFHHFHQCWANSICAALNSGRLPNGYYALLEQHAAGVIPDVVTLERGPNSRAHPGDEEIYAAKADQIAVHSPLGDVVAVIEVVSPGNKKSKHAIRSFVEKALDLLLRGINLLIIDLFPPGRRDPQGIHKVIWDEVQEEEFELPSDKPLTMLAYSAGFPKKAYVEPVAVGDTLRDMPVFLDPATYILAPLESTYLSTWESCPEQRRELISAPARSAPKQTPRNRQK